MADATPQIVNLINPEGRLVGVPAPEVGAALQLGYRQESPEEHEARWRQERYGGSLGDELAAGALGAARGISFGLSDQLLTKGRLVAPEALSAYREANPDASMAGEIGGAVLPVLASGGTGAIGAGARVAGVLPRAAAGAGRAAEQFVAKKLAGVGLKGIGARLLEQGASKAAGGAVEGLAYGAGQLVSEDALGNTELTAERIIAHLGMSAVLGGTVGVALGAGSVAASSGASKLGSLAGRALRGSTVAEKAKNWIDEFATSSRMRAAFGQNKRAYTQMNRKTLAEIDETIPAEKMLEAADAKVQKLINGGAKTQREIAEGLLAERDVARTAIGELVDQMDSTLKPGFRAQPGRGSTGISGKSLAKKVRQEVVAQYKGSAAYRDAFDRANTEADKLAEMGELKFSQAVRERQGQQASANYEREAKNGAASDIHAKIARVINAAIDEKAPAVLESLKLDPRAYAMARRELSLLEEISGHAENRMLGDQANRLISLTDTGMAGAGVAGSLAIGTAGPAAIVTGAAAGLVNKAGRTYGPALLSRAAQFTADRLGVIKRTSDGVSKRVTGAIDAFVKATRKTEPTRAAVPASVQVLDFPITKPARRAAENNDPPAKKYRRRLDEVLELARSPEQTTERLARSIAGFSEEAPRVASHVAAKASQAVQFLAAKAPKDQTPASLLNPLARKWLPSSSELAKWARYVAAVDDPMSVLDELQSNTLSREAVEAVKVVYPQLYDQIRVELMGRVGELQEELPYRQRVQLSILFDAPLDPTLQPQFVTSIQSIYASVAKQAAAAQGSPSQGGKSETAAALATTSERLLQG
jgi:hypothetical protein